LYKNKFVCGETGGTILNFI